jgi:hypothetical protein
MHCRLMESLISFLKKYKGTINCETYAQKLASMMKDNIEHNISL